MKKILLFLCVISILASMCACGSKNSSEDTSEMIFDGETGEFEDLTSEDATESAILSTGGTEAGLWPSEDVPSEIPAFENYTQMYNVSYSKNGSNELWCLGFDSTTDEYNAWLDKLAQKGFKQSDKISGYWADGKTVLDVYSEDNGDGTVYVSIDIMQSEPIEYPDEVSSVYSEFSTDSTVLYWCNAKQDDGTMLFTISYVCGSNYDADLDAYKVTLKDKGFSVEDNKAILINKDGTYICSYGTTLSAYENRLTFTYNG